MRNVGNELLELRATVLRLEVTARSPVARFEVVRAIDELREQLGIAERALLAPVALARVAAASPAEGSAATAGGPVRGVPESDSDALERAAQVRLAGDPQKLCDPPRCKRRSGHLGPCIENVFEAFASDARAAGGREALAELDAAPSPACPSCGGPGAPAQRVPGFSCSSCGQLYRPAEPAPVAPPPPAPACPFCHACSTEVSDELAARFLASFAGAPEAKSYRCSKCQRQFYSLPGDHS